MKKILCLLPLLILTGCGLEAEGYTGADESLIIPLSFGDVAPLLILCAACLLLLVQAPLLTWWRVRRGHCNLFSAAFSWFGFTTGLSMLPLCRAVYQDTFYPHIAGPCNPGKSIFVLLEVTCPLVLAGLLLVAFVTLCRRMWRDRKKG